MLNPVQSETVSSVKSAYRKSRAPIWRVLEDMLERRSSMVEVNIDRIARNTKSGSVVVVPGKVLGSGKMEHKITLGAFSFSQTAAKKIVDAGGSIMSIQQLVEKFPDGSKVTIIA
jgi:large subunit ribosomal protein L18e